MLKIRLQRTGRINNPSYRVVVLEHTESTKSGKIVEQVGSYDPKSKAKNLSADRIQYWISVGAQATGTVHNMLVTAGIVKGKKVNVLPQKSPPKKEGEAEVAEAPKAEAPVAEATPVEATA
jgi:small subunit ribosomal protein S16